MDPPTYPFEETSFMDNPLGEGDGTKLKLPFEIFSTLSTRMPRKCKPTAIAKFWTCITINYKLAAGQLVLQCTAEWKSGGKTSVSTERRSFVCEVFPIKKKAF